MVSSTSAIINKRSSKGRQKIEIKKMEAKSSRQVAFSKRRVGLFKKAVELCVLTGAKVAVLVESPGGKVYMLGEDLIDDWYGNNDVVETGQPTNEFNECYGDVSAVDNSSNSEQESNIGQLEEMKKDAVDELKMNSNIPEKLGSEEMKKNLVMEDDNDSIMINNSQPMFDSDFSLDMSWINTYSEHGVNLNFHHGVQVLNRNIPAKMGSEEMKKNLVVEDDNDSMIINNTQAVLDSDEMKKNVVNEANDLMINNSHQPMFDSDLSLDMSWSDSDMSWLDSDTIDMSWINSYSQHGVNLNFHHGVQVLNRNIPAKMGSEEMKKNLVVEDDNDSMIINNSQAVLDSDEMNKNVVNEANDLMTIPMLDSDLSLDMSWSHSDMSWLDSDMSWINNYPEHGDTHTFDMKFHHGGQV